MNIYVAITLAVGIVIVGLGQASAEAVVGRRPAERLKRSNGDGQPCFSQGGECVANTECGFPNNSPVSWLSPDCPMGLVCCVWE
ncbi:unnamed protein product [Cyprideis torosa]|uniref:Uncharacterized protein n=1 Tax=Cyprideis torosa TaxID=163714 RepID=A0A7R8W5H2_9CRUS|nr:unnamed protein product [Cyprideis torosa]CAG0882882.1 unnamed protein product [Cyprideis torosa]